MGICIRFNENKFAIQILNKNYNYLKINNNDELCIYFQNVDSNDWIDYIEGFTGLFYLESLDGDVAITFEISDSSEYKINFIT